MAADSSSSSSKAIVLITGGTRTSASAVSRCRSRLGLETDIVIAGNSGIGFELAAQLMAKGSYHVLLGARSEEKGQKAVQDLSGRGYPGTVEFVHLDVTEDESIATVARTIEQVRPPSSFPSQTSQG
jgi:NAD(P)-dependent dehydrogenase (short-subunit alcohol dehydrogenase family)